MREKQMAGGLSAQNEVRQSSQGPVCNTGARWKQSFKGHQVASVEQNPMLILGRILHHNTAAQCE